MKQNAIGVSGRAAGHQNRD